MKSSKQRNIYIATIILSVIAIAFGVAALIFLLPVGLNKGIIFLGEDGTVSSEISLEELYPGKESGCTVKFSSFGGEERIVISFTPDGNCDLAEYTDVVIILDGEQLQSGRLSEHLGGSDIEFSRSWQSGEHEIAIKFVIPKEIGNEAAETSAKLIMTVTKSRT